MSRTLKDSLAARLLALGLKPTAQRLHVAMVLLDKPQHLSAEEVLGRVKRRGGRVSKATVYNTLRAFADAGLLREVAIDPERVFYDSTVEPHHHVFDESSHQLTDIPGGAVRVSGLPPPPPGTEAVSVEVVVRVRARR
jgi:Fur family iron response transcriptional regulator